MSPEGKVRSGSSRMQLRTALLSAPMAALTPRPEGPWREGFKTRKPKRDMCQCEVVGGVACKHKSWFQGHVDILYLFDCTDCTAAL